MLATFAMAGYLASSAATESATRAASSAAHKVQNLKSQVRLIEANLAKALMINEALWEFIKEHHKLTDEQLNEKLYQIDMRDGQLDGKNQRTTAIECPKCHRTVSARHASCFYCGQIIDDSVFSMK